MFTGIIQAKGSIEEIDSQYEDVRFLIEAKNLSLEDIEIGASISINGVCLTVVKFVEQGFWVDISKETLDCTTLGELSVGSTVNLEKSLTLSSSLGGHLVSGHVDGVGELIDSKEDARSWRFVIKAPDNLAKYIAKKGSICVDGTSLTVNSVNGSEFDVNIIPHTMEKTLCGDYKVGSHVNLEVDIIARYLERMSSFIK
jgi:riboflavin synthase